MSRKRQLKFQFKQKWKHTDTSYTELDYPSLKPRRPGSKSSLNQSPLSRQLEGEGLVSANRVKIFGEEGALTGSALVQLLKRDGAERLPLVSYLFQTCVCLYFFLSESVSLCLSVSLLIRVVSMEVLHHHNSSLNIFSVGLYTANFP